MSPAAPQAADRGNLDVDTAGLLDVHAYDRHALYAVLVGRCWAFEHKAAQGIAEGGASNT